MDAKKSNFSKVSSYYKSKEIAANYDDKRFSSFSGRLFNSLEKHSMEKLTRFLKKRYFIKSILDIPCGTGRMTEVFVKEGLEVTAADISEEMINIAKEKMSRFSKVNYEITNIKRMFFSDNFFDCIACIRLFHHLNSQDRVDILKELARVSKAYIIINLSFSSPWYRLRRKFKKMLGQGVSKFSVTSREIKEDLDKCGLKEIGRIFIFPIVSEDLILILRK